jgi:hypothetical protein
MRGVTLTRPCETCGTEMRIFAHIANRKRFCSQACKVVSQTTRQQQNCEVCGKPFSVIPSARGKRRTCSFPCANALASARMQRDVRDRLMEKVVVNESGCWIFTGSINREGYGQIRCSGRSVKAHRASYLVHVGPISDGLELDHLCRTRACVNPQHLEPVTHRENMVRGHSANFDEYRRKVATGKCRRGHDAAAGQKCKRCDAERRRERVRSIAKKGAATP